MKGLLLGAAAGLVAMSSAQAADLPVKAKPVEYVKVCSLYGAGFFYVPGTNTCLKIGAYIRSDHGYGNLGSTASYTTTQGNTGSNANGLRNGQDFYSFRARVNLTTDWRTQSDYGVIRAYAAIIAQQTNGATSNDAAPSGSAGFLRAFIQFAGFTFGHAVSYFDFFNGADYGYVPGNTASTGVLGTDIIAYTWQLGNGWSASINLEDGTTGRARSSTNASLANQWGTATSLSTVTNSAEKARSPDIAGNIRIDQAWGSAQVMGALHNASGGYYAGVGTLNATNVVNTNGHPGDVWGWAVGAGFRLNNFLMPKDRFEFQATYGKGATGYVTTQSQSIFSGNVISNAYTTDGVYVTGSDIELTEAWNLQFGYEHYWNAQWRTSIYDTYAEVNYSDTAAARMCGTATNANATAMGAVTPTNCSPSFSSNNLSTRTAWNPHPTLEIGLDLIWAHFNTGFKGLGTLNASTAGLTAGPLTIDDQDRYLAVLRVQKTILP
jgi:hypothetical protein